MEDIAFNTKTEEGITGETVRVVTIEEWDVAACGGTHVRNTSEIGPISILSRSNPGEGLTRVELTVGPPGIDHRSAEKLALLSAASTLEAAPLSLPDEAQRLLDKTTDLEAEVARLSEEVLTFKLATIQDSGFEKAGDLWVVGAITGFDPNTLSEHAKELARTGADVVVLVGETEQTFLVVASTTVEADGIVDIVTEEFGGGGGGNTDFAQAGGIAADPQTVIEFLH